MALQLELNKSPILEVNGPLLSVAIVVRVERRKIVADKKDRGRQERSWPTRKIVADKKDRGRQERSWPTRKIVADKKDRGQQAASCLTMAVSYIYICIDSPEASLWFGERAPLLRCHPLPNIHVKILGESSKPGSSPCQSTRTGQSHGPRWRVARESDPQTPTHKSLSHSVPILVCRICPSSSLSARSSLSFSVITRAPTSNPRS